MIALNDVPSAQWSSGTIGKMLYLGYNHREGNFLHCNLSCQNIKTKTGLFDTGNHKYMLPLHKKLTHGLTCGVAVEGTTAEDKTKLDRMTS